MIILGLPEWVIARPKRAPFPLKLVTEYELPLFARRQAGMKVGTLGRGRVDQFEPPRKRSSLSRSVDATQVIRAARIPTIILAVSEMLSDGPTGKNADQRNGE